MKSTLHTSILRFCLLLHASSQATCDILHRYAQQQKAVLHGLMSRLNVGNERGFGQLQTTLDSHEFDGVLFEDNAGFDISETVEDHKDKLLLDYLTKNKRALSALKRQTELISQLRETVSYEERTRRRSEVNYGAHSRRMKVYSNEHGDEMDGAIRRPGGDNYAVVNGELLIVKGHDAGKNEHAQKVKQFKSDSVRKDKAYARVVLDGSPERKWTKKGGKKKAQTESPRISIEESAISESVAEESVLKNAARMDGANAAALIAAHLNGGLKIEEPVLVKEHALGDVLKELNAQNIG